MKPTTSDDRAVGALLGLAVAADRPADACRVLGATTAAFISGEPAESVFDPSLAVGRAAS